MKLNVLLIGPYDAMKMVLANKMTSSSANGGRFQVINTSGQERHYTPSYLKTVIESSINKTQVVVICFNGGKELSLSEAKRLYAAFKDSKGGCKIILAGVRESESELVPAVKNELESFIAQTQLPFHFIVINSIVEDNHIAELCARVITLAPEEPLLLESSANMAQLARAGMGNSPASPLTTSLSLNLPASEATISRTETNEALKKKAPPPITVIINKPVQHQPEEERKQPLLRMKKLDDAKGNGNRAT